MNGKLHGLVIKYNTILGRKADVISDKIMYVHGKKHGYHEHYQVYKYENDGTPVAYLSYKVPFVNGVPHGTEYGYRIDGSIEYKDEWVNGKVRPRRR